MDIITLIPVRRKVVDDLTVETRKLLKVPVFEGVWHFLGTSESLTFKRFFKRPEIYQSHGTYPGYKVDVAKFSIEMF